VPDGAADWSDDPAAACAGAADCVDDAVPDSADCPDELPESDVQTATKIPATRKTDAINMIIAKCLQKKPQDRYASVADIIADLRRLDRGE
jgi:hypothetical protein